MHFWNLGYRCVTFRDIDMTPTIKKYAQILNFPNDPHKVYFRQRIKNTDTKVVKLLHLDQIDQYKMFNGEFKWKLIENKMKANKDKGKLGEEKY
jgi:hypothetical protein